MRVDLYIVVCKSWLACITNREQEVMMMIRLKHRVNKAYHNFDPTNVREGINRDFRYGWDEMYAVACQE